MQELFACTVHLDVESTCPCITTVSEAARKKVTTIEGLARGTKHSVLTAWIAQEVPQCGYCQPGQIMTAQTLLARKPNPTRRLRFSPGSGS